MSESKSNQIVVTRNGKNVEKPKKSKKSKSTITLAQGPPGPQGPPGESFLLDSITPFECDDQSCRRLFVFGDLSPSMFSQYDGYVINDKLYQLERTTNREEFNKYLMSKHGLKAEDDGRRYSIHLPNQITSFAVKPTGFVNPNTIPPNCITSKISDHSYKFLVMDEDLHYLDCREITGLIKDVVHREQLIDRSSRRSISGQVVTDVDGVGLVELPLGAEFNTICNYTLTPIGSPAPNLHVLEEIIYSSSLNRSTFKIAGAGANQKVTWRVEKC